MLEIKNSRLFVKLFNSFNDRKCKEYSYSNINSHVKVNTKIQGKCSFNY